VRPGGGKRGGEGGGEMRKAVEKMETDADRDETKRMRRSTLLHPPSER